ncbi:MAG TPA: hypothetical protein VND90_11110 [Terracidiphilus sp.]|nr:hypothetical protein [Terracidiphilus sp.]
MPDLTIEIPNGSGDPSMPNADGLKIKVTAECKWCFSDSSGVFPTTGSNALPTTQSTLSAGWYGPYQPNPGVTGTVFFNTSDTDKTCLPEGLECTPRSITVT